VDRPAVDPYLKAVAEIPERNVSSALCHAGQIEEQIEEQRHLADRVVIL
jgi:hypothetical protein